MIRLNADVDEEEEEASVLEARDPGDEVDDGNEGDPLPGVARSGIMMIMIRSMSEWMEGRRWQGWEWIRLTDRTLISCCD